VQDRRGQRPRSWADVNHAAVVRTGGTGTALELVGKSAELLPLVERLRISGPGCGSRLDVELAMLRRPLTAAALAIATIHSYCCRSDSACR